MSTSSHSGSAFCYKAYSQQWQQYQVPATNLDTSVDTILPVMNLHGRQKQPGKADQPVETVNRHSAIKLLSVYVQLR